MTSTVFAFQRWIHVFVVLTWRMFKNNKHNGCTWCFTPLTFFPKGPTFIIPLRFTDNNLVHDAFYLICYRLNAKKPRDLSCNNKFIAYVDYVSVTCFSHHLVFWIFPFHIRQRARKLSQKTARSELYQQVIGYVDDVSVTCFSHYLVFGLFPFHVRFILSSGGVLQKNL